MHYYKVNLPRNNHWDNDYDNWIERSYTSGNAFQHDHDDDDQYGIIGSGSKLDDIPILIGETDDIEVID